MKFLLDANLPQGLADTISRKFGFDCYRVSSRLEDEVVIQQATKEKRILLTLDTDFSNILRYPPEKHGGVIVFRLKNQSYPHVTEAVLDFFASHRNKLHLLAGKTSVVRKNLCRIYQP